MPLPRPVKGEKRSNFVSRCMKNKQVMADFKTPNQRLAVCFSQFRKKR